MIQNVWYGEMLEEWQEVDSEIGKIKENWETFIKTGNVADKNQMSLEVLSSWERCRERGVDPFKKMVKVLSPNQVKRMKAEMEPFLEIAEPILKEMADTTGDDNLRFDVYSPELYLVARIGSTNSFRGTPRLNIQLGTSMNEFDVGTNSVALASLMEKPVQLSSYEHFNSNYHRFTSAALPVKGWDGKVAAVINLDCKCWPIHKHTLSMLIGIKRNIEQKLYQRYGTEQEMFFEQLLEKISDRSDASVAVVRADDTIMFVNRRAAQELSSEGESLTGHSSKIIWGERNPFKEVIGTGRPIENREVIFDQNGSTIRKNGIVEPIVASDGVVLAAVGLFRSKSSSSSKRDMGRAGFKAYYTFDYLLTRNENMMQIIRLAKETARMNSNILIQGETGTGKELFAQAIHNESQYREGPFIAVNCSAIPTGLLESELFGYEEGAFTGARKGGRIGKFELATNGTIFLDEINSMPFDMQAKILRAIQNKTISRVGGSDEIPINVRIIAASNMDLWDMVNRGEFREDLFYRINVIRISLPPLRERTDDIAPLIDLNLRKISDELKKTIDIDNAAIDRLERYSWPGNVRELENVIERSVVKMQIRGASTISAEDVDIDFGSDTAKEEEKKPIEKGNGASRNYTDAKSLGDTEKMKISEALESNNWNISKAAAELGIARNTLYRKIRRYGLER